MRWAIWSLCVFLLLFLVACSTTDEGQVGKAYVPGESYVQRTFLNTSPIEPGSIFNIALDVVVTKADTYYAFQEFVPKSFIILNEWGADFVDNASDPQVLKELEIASSPIANKRLIYTVQATEVGEFLFEGSFQFQHSTDGEGRMLGQRWITVVSEPPVVCDKGIASCTDCWKGKCDGSCNTVKEGPTCLDCAQSFCCGDGVCEAAENTFVCPGDCPCTTDADCDDNVFCTTDTCAAGVCQNVEDPNCADCGDCFKGVCDGSCHPKKDGPSCPDCS